MSQKVSGPTKKKLIDTKVIRLALDKILNNHEIHEKKKQIYVLIFLSWHFLHEYLFAVLPKTS